MKLEIYSDLELLVMNDMILLGFDPNNQNDIRKYWEMLLNEH